MKHWAYDYIGKPWRSGAMGPHAFNCWGLVRDVFLLRYGLDLPEVYVGTDTNVRAMQQIVKHHGWRCVQEPAQADDIVLMRGRSGRHVGVMIDVQGKLYVLHANGYESARGPVGCVMLQTLTEVLAKGYGDLEIWRRL